MVEAKKKLTLKQLKLHSTSSRIPLHQQISSRRIKQNINRRNLYCSEHRQRNATFLN